MQTKKALMEGLFFYCGNAGLDPSKSLRSPRARAVGNVRAAFFQYTTPLYFLSIGNLYKIHKSGIPIFVRSDESKKVVARGLTNRCPHAIMYLQGKGNRYSHSTDQVLSLNHRGLSVFALYRPSAFPQERR